MSTIQLKRSSVASKVPLTSDLALGELAMNTNDGLLFFKKDPGTPSIVTLVTTDATQTLTNKTFTDSLTTFQDDADNTKKFQFQASAIATNTTRTITIPNATGTMSLIGLGETITGAKVFRNSAGIKVEQASTQDAMIVTGRAGGTSSYTLTLTPTTLTSSKTATFQDLDGTVALTANKLSAFASTTSSELAGVISDETGSGSLVFGTSPTISGVTLTGTASISANATFTGTQILIDNGNGADEGGEIRLSAATTNSTLSGPIVIDIYQNRIRFFENGGTNRGAYIDLTAATAGAGSNLLAGGSGGATNLTLSSNSSTVTIFSDTGTDAIILAANATTAGVLTADAQTIGGVKTLTGTLLNGNTNFDSGVAFIDGTNNLLLVNTTTPYLSRYAGGSAAGATSYAPLQVHTDGAFDTKANFTHWGSGTVGGRVQLGKSKGALGTHTIVAAADLLGELQFLGSDGSEFVMGANIRADVEGTPAANNIAAAITFRTANTGSGSTIFERMRVSSNGNIGIGNTAPVDKLSVNGTAYFGANVTILAALTANGSVGTAGQVLTSNSTGTYWSTPSASGATNLTLSSNGSTVTILSDTGTDAIILAANATTAGVLTAEAQIIAGIKTFSSNVVISGAITANGSVGTAGQVLTSNATGTYWSTPSATGGVSKFSANVGNASNTTFTIIHNLNSTDPIIAVREISSGYYIYPDIKYVTSNSIALEFTVAPTANQYYVSIIGA